MPQKVGTVRVPRVAWACSRPGCEVNDMRVPHLAKMKYCSRRCAQLVTQPIRYANTPKDWSNFAARYRKENDLGDKCQICGLPEFSRRPQRHHLDHDHATGRVRGLLCQGCNLHLGRWETRGGALSSYLAAADNMPVRGSLETARKRDFPQYRAGRPTCEACGAAPKGKPLSVDHCHRRMVVRGVLCIPCNVTLGWYENNAPAVGRYLA